MAVISPLEFEPDEIGVNTFTGRVALDLPVLSIPAAPRLSMQRVQDVAPYVEGFIQASGDQWNGSFSVHAGKSTSESFTCDENLCEAVKGSGSVLGIIDTGNSILITLKEGQSGTNWIFNKVHTYDSYSSGGGNRTDVLNYAWKSTFTDGEVVEYSYDTAIEPSFGRTHHRPEVISSNVGYKLSLTYHPGPVGSVAWVSPATAKISSAANPALALRTFSYSSDGTVITVNDGGQYACANCRNLVDIDTEVSAGSITAPGSSSPLIEVAKRSSEDVVERVTKNGSVFEYSYQNLRWNGYRYIFDAMSVSGPENYNVVYSKEFRKLTFIDSIGRKTHVDYDNFRRVVRLEKPGGDVSELEYDDFGNIVKFTSRAKPGSNQADKVVSATFPTGDPSLCSSASPHVRCFRPLTLTDARGNVTQQAYNDRGLLTQITSPADSAGIRARTTVNYENSGGLYRKSSIRLCDVSRCGQGQGFLTEFDYWRDTFLVREKRVIDETTGEIMRSCYGYDEAGNLISETQPSADLAACP